MITGRQIREGRKLAGLSVLRLARAAKLEAATIIRAEAEEGEPPITMRQAAKIDGALTKAGVEFIPENGGALGCGRVSETNKEQLDATSIIHAEFD